MSEEIIITAKDNYSEVVRKMRESTSRFASDVDGLSKKLNALNQNKASLKVDFSEAQHEMKEAQRAFDKTGQGLERLQNANFNFDRIQSNLGALSREAVKTEKSLASLGTQSGTGGGKFGAVMGKVGSSGALEAVGQVAMNGATSFAGSMWGDEGATMASNTLGLASQGAMIGLAFGPLGAAIGAAGGALVGAVNGLIETGKNKDEAFRNTVQTSYDTVLQSREESRINGSSLAAERENSAVWFGQMFGDAEAGKQYQSQLQRLADGAPYVYEELAGLSKTLKNCRYSVDEMMPQMKILGNTGAALGLSMAEVDQVAQVLGEMKATGKVSLEQLSLLESLRIDGAGMLAEQGGITADQVKQQVKNGTFDGSQAAGTISRGMGEQYQDGMENASNTFSAKEAELKKMRDSLDAARGEGYNATREEGIQKELDWLSSYSGQQLEDSYRKIGEFQAELENSREQANRDAMEAVLTSGEYEQAMHNGDAAQMQTLLGEAQAQGINEYKAGEGYQKQQQADMELIQRIQSDTALNDQYYLTGYELGQQLSEGIASGMNNGIGLFQPGLEKDGLYNSTIFADGPDAGRELPDWQNVTRDGIGGGNTYPVYNPNVLTTSANKTTNISQTVNVAGEFTVREPLDVGRIANEIAKQLKNAQEIGE